jgi:hypothetical protein
MGWGCLPDGLGSSARPLKRGEGEKESTSEEKNGLGSDIRPRERGERERKREQRGEK